MQEREGERDKGNRGREGCRKERERGIKETGGERDKGIRRREG